MFLFQVSGAVSPPEKLRAFAFLWDLPDGVAIVILGIDDALGIVIITSVKISVPSTVKSPFGHFGRSGGPWWCSKVSWKEDSYCPKLEKDEINSQKHLHLTKCESIGECCLLLAWPQSNVLVIGISTCPFQTSGSTYPKLQHPWVKWLPFNQVSSVTSVIPPPALMGNPLWMEVYSWENQL